MYIKATFAALSAIALVSGTPTDLNKRAFPASVTDFNELHRAATLASAAYSGCQIEAFDVNITLQLNNLTTDTQGFVGYSPSLQRISVTMRGSTSPQDFANDMDTTPVTPTLSGVNFPPGTQIMNGVYTPWSSVHDIVIAEFKRLIELYPNYSLESAGHSLGGSLTYLSYIALAQNFPGKPLVSNALAAFPIGNTEFANFGTSQKGELRRGNNYDDGVPNFYPQFTHYGIEFYGSGTAATTVQCVGEYDPQCSAGNGLVGITPGHFESFGVQLGLTGCGGGIPIGPDRR